MSEENGSCDDQVPNLIVVSLPNAPGFSRQLVFVHLDPLLGEHTAMAGVGILKHGFCQFWHGFVFLLTLSWII